MAQESYPFTIVCPTSGATFRDALLMTPEAYAALTPNEVTVLQQARFTAWRESVLNPLPCGEPPQ